MTKEHFNHVEYSREFFRKFYFIYKNRVEPSKSLHDYLINCGYKPDREPFLYFISGISVYHVDILQKYANYFLFSNIVKENGSIFDLFFNIDEKLHIMFGIFNIPEENKKDSRFVAVPTFISEDHWRILEFIDGNEEFKVHPTTPKSVGFSHLGNFSA